MAARPFIRPFLAYAATGVLLTLAWFRLEGRGVSVREVVGLLLVGLVPTAAVALGRRRAVVAGLLALAILVAAGIAVGVSPLEARPGGGHDFFGPVLGAMRDGVQDFYEASLPFDRVDYPHMHALALFAVFAFAVLAGMLAAARRVLLAALMLLVGLGWPATLVPGERPLLAGALTLGGILLYLFLFRVELATWRSLLPAAVAVLALVLAAVGASTAPAVAKGAFLDWQGWDFYDPPDDPVSVQYVWTSQYAGISFPKKRTTVLKVKVDGPRRPLYWRATTLDDYNGTNWNEASDLTEPRDAQDEIDVGTSDPLLPAGAANQDRWVRQEVTVEALQDSRLIGSAQPVRWQPETSLAYQVGPGGSVLLASTLRQGQRYSVSSYAPRPRSAELAQASTQYPAALPERYFDPLSGAQVPRFGAVRRDSTMQSLFATSGDSFLRENEPLWELARRLTTKARSPYEAAILLETWFRDPTKGEFTYDQSPPQPTGNYPPLLDFVLNHRRGYCQQFAGSMTLMLRLLGVPARIAAGFTSGTYDEDSHTWTVVDRNAHTWVEVYFPGYGWLPFDPTPGRGTLDAPYSYASSSATLLSEKGDLGEYLTGVLGGANLGPNGLLPRSQDPRTGREDASATGGPRRGTGAVAGSGADPGGGSAIDTSLIALLAVLLAGGSVAIVLAKLVRRRIRLATRDPRRLAAACRRDLVGFLADQGTEPPPSATVTELGELVESEFAVDADHYVRSLGAARFGPLADAPAAARTARRELGRLRREMWRQLTWGGRIRTALSFRSLTS